MNIVVLKFGGTSVADVPQIKKISYKIKSEVDQGNKVIVVVSAMSLGVSPFKVSSSYNLKFSILMIIFSPMVVIGIDRLVHFF